MEKFISLPFRISDSGYRGIEYSNSPSQKYRQFIACVLLTNIKERIMRPTYGSNLVLSEFDSSFGPSVEQQVQDALNTWVPNITVNYIQILEEDFNPVAIINYSLPNGTNETLTVQQTRIDDTVRFAVKTEQEISGEYVDRITLPTGQVLYE